MGSTNRHQLEGGVGIFSWRCSPCYTRVCLDSWASYRSDHVPSPRRHYRDGGQGGRPRMVMSALVVSPISPQTPLFQSRCPTTSWPQLTLQWPWSPAAIPYRPPGDYHNAGFCVTELGISRTWHRRENSGCFVRCGHGSENDEDF